MNNYQGKKVVITGGGSGIGRAMSIAFAKQGAKVYVWDLESAQSQVLALQQEGLDVHFQAVDVSKEDIVQAAADAAGKVDVLINNAGIAHIGNLEQTQSSDFQRLFDINVKGAFHCMKAVLPGMLAQQSGVILNLASVAASVGIPDRFAYTMTKGAIASMTRSVAKDYLHKGIRCNAISPARVHTPFVEGYLSQHYPGQEQEMFAKLSATQPIGRMAKPEEIANLALYLCSDAAGFITGCDYPIDGGFMYLNN